jgi:mannose-1-phosphate guanylyltransferase
MASGRRWTISLAAGDGERVRGMTTDRGGKTIPKQYWAPAGAGSMLRRTYDRARRVASPAHIVTVVAEQHREWWEDLLPAFMTTGLVVQPVNRGTGPGILLPLLHVLRRDREATVAILPCDQYVEDEPTLEVSLKYAFALAEGPRRLVLLGMTPAEPDPGYGWVLSGHPDADGTRPVELFVEKPGPRLTRHLYRTGASWSSFMLVARGSSLLALFQAAMPLLFRALAGVPGDRLARDGGRELDSAALEQAYENLPRADFSRDLLQRFAVALRVLPVPPCGWTDLGTPERLEQWLRARKHGAVAPDLEPTAA